MLECFIFILCNASLVTEPITIRQYSNSVLLESTSETSANASVGDLDGDGHPDVILAKGRHWPLHNRILFNDGKGHFYKSKNLGPEPDRTYSAVIADLDNDGHLDVAISNDSPDKKMIYMNNGKGDFRVSGTWGSPKWNTRNAAAIDFNGDGYTDLIAANRKSDSFVCLNDGLGNFHDKGLLKSHQNQRRRSCLEILMEMALSILRFRIATEEKAKYF